MMGKRYIKLYEQITEWEWYKDINTFRLFVHLLLKANYKDVNFRGRVIHRGQIVTSLSSLAANTSLSIRQVRDSLNHLVMTGEVTNESTSQYRVITIVKYSDYQANDKQIDKQVTNKLTSKRQTNDKQVDNKYRNIEQIELKKDKRIPSVFTQPSVGEVEDYCRERNNGISGQEFVDFYESKGWMIGKNKMKDWKAAVRTWERNRKGAVSQKPDARDVHGYEQRDYSSEQAAAVARMMNDGWGDEP